MRCAPCSTTLHDSFPRYSQDYRPFQTSLYLFFNFFLDVKSRFPPSSNFSRFPVFTHVLIVRLRNFRVPKKLLLGSKINMKTVNKQSNPKISLRKLFELGIVKMRKFFAFQTSKCVKFKTVILHKRITD